MTRKEVYAILEKLDWGSWEILTDDDGYIRVLISVEEDHDE